MKKFGKLREKYFGSNIMLAILAVVIAVFLWLFISLTQYPTMPKTVYHIPVSIDISGSTANQNGLSVISCDVSEVTVELLASRTQIGYLNNENLTAYFDSNSVSNAGTKKLSLEIKSENGEHFDVISVSPESATVVFDKLDTREFEVTPLTPNLKTVDGKAINPSEYICLPSEIRITGPSAQLDKIAKCYAVSNSDLTLASKVMLNCDEIQLYTEDNTLIDQSAMKISNTNIEINVAVRTQKTVDLYVSVMNAPPNFNTDILNFELSEKSVTLACNNSQTEIPEELDIGLVSLNDLKPGFSTTLSLKKRLETTELINVSDLDAITVTLNNTDLKEKQLILDKSRIVVSNPPDSKNYEYSILTQQLDITVVGPEESIAQITPDDIVAEVNLLNLNINTDQFYQNVTFSCPSFDDVWVATNSKVSVQRTKTEQTTTTIS